MSNTPLDLETTYDLTTLAVGKEQLYDTHAAFYVGDGEYPVVETKTGRTVGALYLHPSGAFTAKGMDGGLLLIEGGRFYYGDRGPQGTAQLVTWPNP